MDYRLKEYSPSHKNKLEVGQHVLVFNPTRKVGEASKLKRGWSLPFKLTKKLNEICFEMESLAWANPKFKIVRSISHIKPYHGSTEFKKVKQQQDPKDFMSKHQFEIIEEDEPTILPNVERQSSQEDASQERIRLPSGNWIIRSRITGEQRDTLQFDDERGERETVRDIMAPNSQQASTNEEERVIPDQQDIGEDEQSPPQPPPTQDANNCAAPNCVDPDGTHANYINCIHCAKQFHIRCVGFTERRAINESYICTQCERSL